MIKILPLKKSRNHVSITCRNLTFKKQLAPSEKHCRSLQYLYAFTKKVQRAVNPNDKARPNRLPPKAKISHQRPTRRAPAIRTEIINLSAGSIYNKPIPSNQLPNQHKNFTPRITPLSPSPLPLPPQKEHKSTRPNNPSPPNLTSSHPSTPA
jgi:hypothetical protein